MLTRAGQTPDFVAAASYGAYIFLGLMCASSSFFLTVSEFVADAELPRCVFGAAYVFWFVPETKGRTLDEIDELFGDKSGRSAHEMQMLHRAYEDVGLTAFVGGEKSALSDERHTVPSEKADAHHYVKA